MSVYAEIFEWSKSLHEWQRDALRRLVTGSIDATHLGELEYIALKSQGLIIPGYEALTPQPLQQSHLPIRGNGGIDVSLTSIGGVSNVNLISPSAVLGFELTGLTIIYGYNGSGKSGYARILKRICRARDGGSVIHPNVFEEHDGAPPSANIAFISGDTEKLYSWTDNQSSPIELGQICIFDSSCAEFYVTKENDIAYRPFGLDLFDKLASTADALREKLEARKNNFSICCPPPPVSIATATELKDIYPLTAKTNPNKITSILPLTTEEQNDLVLLKRAVEEENPTKQAAALLAQKGRLTTIAEQIKAISTLLNQSKINEFKAHAESLKITQEEARLISDEAFKPLLPQTGGTAWKNLWEYARTFAAVAYPTESFPNTSQKALCLLCQQPLEDDAKTRFVSFETFVKEEAEKSLAATQQLVTKDIESLKALPIDIPTEDVLNELRSHDEKWASDFAAFKNQSSILVTALLHSFSTGIWSEVVFPCFDAESIMAAIKAIEVEATAILATDDSEELAKRTIRLLSLEARNWVVTNQKAMKDDIIRAQQIEAITKAISTTSTANISRKSTTLTKSHVSDALTTAVESELKSINNNHLNITLASRSTKGATYHRIDMKHRKADRIGVKDIVSEGEFRAIAIAAFFAELGQSGTDSAIVVDDPVSSLDHLHRERVALRLIEEGVSSRNGKYRTLRKSGRFLLRLDYKLGLGRLPAAAPGSQR